MDRAASLLSFIGICTCAIAQDTRLIQVGEGLNGPFINDMVVFNGELVLGGFFMSFNGHARQNLVAWDGGAGFNDLGTAHSTMATWVNDLLVFQGELIACGRSGPSIDTVMAWNGTAWATLGATFNGEVLTLTEHAGELYAGGMFTMCGSSAIDHVARWDGLQWQSVGNGLGSSVRSLASFNGELYAGGDFGSDPWPGSPPYHLARFDGGSWVQVLDGLNSTVSDLLVTSTALWVVGEFDSTGTGTAYPGLLQYDGTIFSAILPPDPLRGKPLSLFDDSGLGPCIGYEYACECSGGGVFVRHAFPGISSGAALGGERYVGGNFEYPGCNPFRDLGRLVSGSDGTWFSPASISAMVSPTNALFQDLVHGSPGFESPVGTDVHSIFSHSLSVGARSASGVYVSSPGVFLQNPGFRSGPWATDTSLLCDRYHQIWPVDQGMIWQHVANWNTPGYIPHPSIATWPGNGDTSNGEPAILAPFNDLDMDGIYEPLNGDHPIFPGESAIYAIVHDSRSETIPVGVDIHMMVHGYHTSTNTALNNSIFVNYRIVNRSSQVFDTVFVAGFTDTDIGCPTDDFAGCDTLLLLTFGYNGDDMDESCSNKNGYGIHPASTGVTPLNTHLFSFQTYSNSGGIGGDPNWHDSLDVWNMMNGRRRHGEPIYDPDSTAVLFEFPGNPSSSSEWSEISQLDDPEDRRLFSSYGPFFNFAPGDTICLDLAFVFAQDSTGDNLSSVTLLKQRVQQLRDWYDAQALACDEYPVLGIPTHMRPVAATLSVVPNPASDQLTITLQGTPGRYDLRIFDPTGAVVLRRDRVAHTTMIDVQDLATGPYIVRVSNASGIATGRFVKTP